MSLSYSEIMSRTAYLQKLKWIPYTGYNAVLYARWLPYAILLPILAAIGMSLSLFLPWLSIGNTDVVKNPIPQTGFEIASNGVPLPGVPFSFTLWLLVALGIALIALSVLLLRSKVLTSLLSLSIKITFGLALLVEVVYWFTIQLFIITHSSTGNQLAIVPSYGLWVCLAVTCIAGGVSLLLFSNLSWYWRLAQEDVKQVMRRTNFQPIRSERAFFNGKEAPQSIDIGYSGTQKS